MHIVCCSVVWGGRGNVAVDAVIHPVDKIKKGCKYITFPQNKG